MRGLVLIVALAGCGEDYPPPDDDDLPDTTWPGVVSWSWTFSDGTACPDDVVTANLYIASYDFENFVFRLEPRIVKTSACSAGGAAFPLENPLGVKRYGHDTWVELVTTDGRVFAKSEVLNTKSGDANLATVVEVPRGWVHVGWQLFGQTTQTALTCDDVSALRATTGDGAVFLYPSIASDVVLAPTDTPCANGETWLGLPAGTHDLTLGAFSSLEFLYNDSHNAMRLGKLMFPAQVVAPNATLELGVQPLPLVDY
jgi:hypothetical protein